MQPGCTARTVWVDELHNIMAAGLGESLVTKPLSAVRLVEKLRWQRPIVKPADW